MNYEEILFVATLLTGIIVLLNAVYLKPKRVRVNEDNLKENILVEYSQILFPLLLLVFFLRSFVAEPFRIPSGSMKPTLLVGDFILVNKYNYGLRMPISGTKFFKIGDPKQGDVIVFRLRKDRKILIKRIVALPGDHVLYRDKNLYINGREIDLRNGKISYDGLITAFEHKEHFNEKTHSIFTYPDYPKRDYRYNNIIVPENTYFVLGDNRDNSQDSRFFGVVNDHDIIGKAVITWLSLDWNIGFDINVRWKRVFQKIQ